MPRSSRVLDAVPAERWRDLFEAADRVTSADLETVGSDAVGNLFRRGCSARR